MNLRTLGKMDLRKEELMSLLLNYEQVVQAGYNIKLTTLIEGSTLIRKNEFIMKKGSVVYTIDGKNLTCKDDAFYSDEFETDMVECSNGKFYKCGYLYSKPYVHRLLNDPELRMPF